MIIHFSLSFNKTKKWNQSKNPYEIIAFHS